MWKTILKAINVPSPDTGIEEIKELMRQAIRLPDLELQLTRIKSRAANEVRLIEKKIEDNSNKIKDYKKQFKEALQNKDKEEMEDLDAAQGQLDGKNITLREELSKIKKTTESKLKTLEKLYKENSKNPFVPIITRRATYSENAVFSKKGIKAEKITPTPSIPLADSYSILDDGYGNEQFYGKATPLTLQEAAEHYKETVVDYDKVNVNRVMPDDKPYDAPYGKRAKDPKTLPSTEVQDLKELKENLKELEKIPEEDRSPNNKRSITRLRNKIKKIEQEINESIETTIQQKIESNRSPIKKPTLPQIRTILQPISNADFNDFIISLDKFVDSGSAPIIDAYKEKNPEKFADIMSLVEGSTSLDSSSDEDRYLQKLMMMVQNKTIEFNRSSKGNRVSLQVVNDNKTRYSKDLNRLILPVNEDLTGKFSEISEWLGRNYEQVPDVKDEGLFIKNLVEGIDNMVADKGGNNSIAYAIQYLINSNLANLFSREVVVTGRYLDSNTEQRKFRQFINTEKRRNMKLLQNVATFLHRGKQVSGFLTQDQMDKANKILQQQVGSKQFGRYFLAEVPSPQLQRKPKSNLSTRLGATGRKKIPSRDPDKPRSAKEVAETYESLREQQNYEPAPKGLTENQKEVLADIRQSYKINTPPSAKTIEENKKKLEQTRAEAEEMSPEEKESNLQEWTDRLVEIALKNKGKTEYEPYTGRKRTLTLGRMVGEENNKKFELYTQPELREIILENVKQGGEPFAGLYLKSGSVSKADLSGLSSKERRKVKTMLQNAHPTEYFGEDYLRLGKVINIIDGLAEDEEAELLEKLGVKNLQMVKTAASLRKKYENLYKKLYDMVYDEEE
jgi:hypothetical protein